MLAHGVVQGAIETAQGGEFLNGFIAGFAGAVSGGITSGIEGNGLFKVGLRTMVAAAIGGTAAELTGGSFANGAVTAAFVHLFNAEMAQNLFSKVDDRYYLNKVDGMIVLYDANDRGYLNDFGYTGAPMSNTAEFYAAGGGASVDINGYDGRSLEELVSNYNAKVGYIVDHGSGGQMEFGGRGTNLFSGTDRRMIEVRARIGEAFRGKTVILGGCDFAGGAFALAGC